MSVRTHKELVPRTVVGMQQDPTMLEQLSKNITRQGITNSTLNYLRVRIFISRLQSQTKFFYLFRAPIFHKSQGGTSFSTVLIEIMGEKRVYGWKPTIPFLKQLEFVEILVSIKFLSYTFDEHCNCSRFNRNNNSRVTRFQKFQKSFSIYNFIFIILNDDILILYISKET